MRLASDIKAAAAALSTLPELLLAGMRYLSDPFLHSSFQSNNISANAILLFSRSMSVRKLFGSSFYQTDMKALLFWEYVITIDEVCS